MMSHIEYTTNEVILVFSRIYLILFITCLNNVQKGLQQIHYFIKIIDEF